jgi:FdhD protein
MRTPGHDEELAAGFLLSEGLITNRSQIAQIAPYPRNPAGNAINFFLASDVVLDFTQLTRHVFASSSCGLCGAATIDAVHKKFPPAKSGARVSAKLLADLPRKLRSEQPGFHSTGGSHAAGLFTLAGEMIAIREDVGRHNAVDKILGFGLLEGLLPFDQHILTVSGRASFEIMQKALAASVPIVLAVSAPSTLAVDFAEKSGQTLIGFARDDRLNVYSHAERVTFAS